MVGVADGPSPPGDYDVVVVGSGPGGLQTSYFLSRFGVRHAIISADHGPGGMFRNWPIFQRLLSWSKPDAPFSHTSREYEWYDQNSLIADEPHLRALVPAQMDRRFVVPSRPEMEAGLAAFARRAKLPVRYGCRWEATAREPDGRLVLTTSDGVYRCRAAVFALGVTEPWKAPIPGIEHATHYADVGYGRAYQGKRVLVIGKRNSAFEIADGLLPWARQVVLVSPRPVHTATLGLSSVRVRYFQPLEDEALGGGTLVLDAAIERIERDDHGFRAAVRGAGGEGEIELHADAVFVATGFRTPLGDLPDLGVTTVAQGRIPALTPFFESAAAPGVYFAGNATQGSPGLRRHGVSASSAAVHGFRYNARFLAEHLADQLGARPRLRQQLEPEDVAPFLARELARAPELWAQKGYLGRIVSLDPEAGPHDEGIAPLEHFVDAPGPDAVAATVEMDSEGRIFPVLYVRRAARVRDTVLDADPLNAFDGPEYERELAALLELG